jgi:hypothetical protein
MWFELTLLILWLFVGSVSNWAFFFLLVIHFLSYPNVDKHGYGKEKTVGDVISCISELKK